MASSGPTEAMPPPVIPEDLQDEHNRSAFREVARRFRDEAAQIYIMVAIALQSFHSFATSADACSKGES